MRRDTRSHSMQLPTNPDNPDSQLYVITLNNPTGLMLFIAQIAHLTCRFKAERFGQIIHASASR